jgi:hypothetical protein
MDGDTDENGTAFEAHMRSALARHGPTRAPERANQPVAADDREMPTHRTARRRVG